jgi:hypothetical protein
VALAQPSPLVGPGPTRGTGDNKAVKAELADENESWVRSLTANGNEREQAVARLYGLLLAPARAEAGKLARVLDVRGPEIDDIACQAAADATVLIVRKITEFRGDAKFTTWAYRIVLNEVTTKIHRHFWHRSATSLDTREWGGNTGGARPPAGDRGRAQRHAGRGDAGHRRDTDRPSADRAPCDGLGRGFAGRGGATVEFEPERRLQGRVRRPEEATFGARRGRLSRGAGEAKTSWMSGNHKGGSNQFVERFQAGATPGLRPGQGLDNQTGGWPCAVSIVLVFSSGDRTITRTRPENAEHT